MNDSQIARGKSIPLLVDRAPRRSFDSTKIKILKADSKLYLVPWDQNEGFPMDKFEQKSINLQFEGDDLPELSQQLLSHC